MDDGAHFRLHQKPRMTSFSLAGSLATTMAKKNRIMHRVRDTLSFLLIWRLEGIKTCSSFVLIAGEAASCGDVICSYVLSET
jgi:hypothetical protein